MTKDIDEIRKRLITILKGHLGALKVTIDTKEKFEVTGTIPTMQGKKKVDGIYFSSIVPKPKDVRFYFFPAYTHQEQIGDLPDHLNKCLKGKSCFYIKYLDEELESSITALVGQGVQLYKEDGLL